MREKAVFRGLDQSLVYQRLVFNAARTVEPQHLLVDYVELNELMPDLAELVRINEISEVFILFGLATLYSCACPIVPLIAMTHNVVDINASLLVSFRSVRRPIAKMATNIHPWLSIAEFMALAAVISNCLLLYFSTPILRKFLYNQLGDVYS